MTWTILYHADVADDLESVGRVAARRIMHAIDTKLTTDPLTFGAPLTGNLTGYRRLRVGDCRVVYHVRARLVVVFVLVVGLRRDMQIYRVALTRQ